MSSQAIRQDRAKAQGRQQAQRLYPEAAACESCGAQPTERHHIDGNTANNARDNIRFLCRRCHRAAHRPGKSVRDTLAYNIDRGIRAKAMTNRAVGDAIGSTEHQVWRWRAGRHVPAPENLAALANVLFDGDIAELYATEEAAA